MMRAVLGGPTHRISAVNSAAHAVGCDLQSYLRGRKRVSHSTAADIRGLFLIRTKDRSALVGIGTAATISPVSGNAPAMAPILARLRILPVELGIEHTFVIEFLSHSPAGAFCQNEQFPPMLKLRTETTQT